MGWSKDHGTAAKVNADYAKVQGDIAKQEANKVERFIEDNKTNWLPAVATVALRNSTYPNPQHGDTVRVTSEAKTYRFVIPTGWVVTDIYDATAIDQVTTQLAQNTAQTNEKIAVLSNNKASKTEVNALANEKADITYVNQKVQAANMQWKMSFDTKGVLESTYPTGDEYNHAVLADGFIYTWYNNAWVNTQITANAQNLADGTVTPAKTTFAKASKNLFDYTTVQSGLINADGTLNTNPSYGHSSAFAIKPSTRYALLHVSHLVFYDADNNFISRMTIDVSTAVITSPATAHFVIVNFLYTPFAPLLTQMVEGSNVDDTDITANTVKLDAFANVNDESITTQKLQDNVVTCDKVDFIKTSKNLFPKRNVVAGHTIDATTGTLVLNASTNASDFIPVEPLTFYVGNQGRWALYDNAKNFIMSSVTPTFKTTHNAAFARITGADVNTLQLNEGLILQTYDEYVEPTLTTDIAKDYITHAPTKNLFTKRNLTIGKVIAANGNVNSNPQYGCSDFIAVKPSTFYTVEQIDTIALYDKNFKFIRRHEAYTDASKTFKTDASCRYIRGNMPNYRYADAAVINEGARIADRNKPRKLSNTDVDITVRKNDYHMLDVPIPKIFNTNVNYPDVTTTWKASNTSDVYALYDELVNNYPNYIKKTTLGNNSQGHAINLYTFKPFKPSADYRTKRPKILIVTGTHGFEKHAVWTQYLVMRDICECWQDDESLELLRHNVEFLIVPVLNPHSYDAFVRCNANGVDLNRNYPTPDWASGTLTDANWGTYGGTSPASELETQYVLSLLEQNPDIDIVFDYHNFASSGEIVDDTNVIWVASANTHVQHMCQTLVSRMTRKWRKDVSFYPVDDDFFVGYSSHGGGGTLGNYVKELGIHQSCTFETAARVTILGATSPLYDTVATKFAVEAMVNWLLINLHELVLRS